jgi:hypothetical protein
VLHGLFQAFPVDLMSDHLLSQAMLLNIISKTLGVDLGIHAWNMEMGQLLVFIPKGPLLIAKGDIGAIPLTNCQSKVSSQCICSDIHLCPCIQLLAITGGRGVLMAFYPSKVHFCQGQSSQSPADCSAADLLSRATSIAPSWISYRVQRHWTMIRTPRIPANSLWYED